MEQRAWRLCIAAIYCLITLLQESLCMRVYMWWLGVGVGVRYQSVTHEKVELRKGEK